MIDQETQALYDLLLEAGADQEQLKEALEERERNGKSFRDVILDYGFCRRTGVADFALTAVFTF